MDWFARLRPVVEPGCRFFQLPCQLKKCEFIPEAADELHTHRQSFSTDMQWQGNGRLAGCVLAYRRHGGERL